MNTFPKDFVWGTATSSCQIEGARNQDGKVDTNWDAFADTGLCANDTPEIACDHYNRYKEDIALLKELGVKAYRFSISWARIVSDLKGTINEKGLEFYSNLVDELIANGIEPWPTLYHWDHPQFLEDAFHGWTNRKMLHHFTTYAEAIIKKLGGRVKNWMTINEPINATYEAYYTTNFAPGTKMSVKDVANSIHHILMAHGIAVRAIRKYSPGSRVGIVENPTIFTPKEETQGNYEKIETIWSILNGYYIDPIYKKEYPKIPFYDMIGCHPDILPGDMDVIGQETDFLGLNCYCSVELKESTLGLYGCIFDFLPEHKVDNAMFYVCPDAMYHAIKYIHDHYNVKEIIITENGNAWKTATEEEQINDDYRIELYKMSLRSIKRAMDEGYKVTGFFAWSLMDNFEWRSGYQWKFGLIHIDKDLKRTPKKSFYWYKELIKQNGFEN